MAWSPHGRFIDIDLKCLYDTDDICDICFNEFGFMLCDECGMCDDEDEWD